MSCCENGCSRCQSQTTESKEQMSCEGCSGLRQEVDALWERVAALSGWRNALADFADQYLEDEEDEPAK